MEHPLDFLNPHEQSEGTCNFCDAPTDKTYCCKACQLEDLK